MIIITTTGQKQQHSRLFVQKRKSLFGHLESLRQPPLEPLHGLLGGETELEARARGGVDVQVHRGRARLRVHSRACDACTQHKAVSGSGGVRPQDENAACAYFCFVPAVYSQKGVGTRTEQRLIPV